MQNETLKLLRCHWKIVTAATMGWALDAFDMTIYYFLIPHLSKEFGVDLKAMSLVVLIMGVGKIIGTVCFGMAADKFGRKLPFMIAILWFCAFSGLSGLAWSYASFIAFRFLFSIGFGGEWGTATSLMMESLPSKIRSISAGLMMAGYELGFLLSALCYYWVFPTLGWRWMFFLGMLPALLAVFVRLSIPESPEWLATRHEAKHKRKLKITLTPAAVQGFAFMLGANCLFYAIFALYPTFLIQVRGLSPGQVFPYVALYSVASIIGKPVASLLARRIGERRVLLTYLVLTIPTTLLYTWFDTPLAMLMGALLIGLITNSIYGIVPTYLARRYPAEERGLGLGIASAFNSVGAVAPYAISIFTASYGLANSMTGAIMIGALFTFMVASCNTKKWFAIPEDTQTTMSRRSRNQVVNS